MIGLGSHCGLLGWSWWSGRVRCFIPPGAAACLASMFLISVTHEGCQYQKPGRPTEGRCHTDNGAFAAPSALCARRLAPQRKRPTYAAGGYPPDTGAGAGGGWEAPLEHPQSASWCGRRADGGAGGGGRDRGRAGEACYLPITYPDIFLGRCSSAKYLILALFLRTSFSLRRHPLLVVPDALAGRLSKGPGREGPTYRSVPARCLHGR